MDQKTKSLYCFNGGVTCDKHFNESSRKVQDQSFKKSESLNLKFLKNELSEHTDRLLKPERPPVDRQFVFHAAGAV